MGHRGDDGPGARASLGGLITEYLNWRTQAHWNQLGGFLQPYNPAVTAWLQARGVTLADPQAAAMLAGELSRQASMMAFVDTFRLIAWSFVLLASLLLLISAWRGAGPERSPIE